MVLEFTEKYISRINEGEEPKDVFKSYLSNEIINAENGASAGVAAGMGSGFLWEMATMPEDYSTPQGGLYSLMAKCFCLSLGGAMVGGYGSEAINNYLKE